VYQIWRPKDSPKKRYSKSTNMCSCEKNFTTANFNSLPRIEIFFFSGKFWKSKFSMLITHFPNFMANRLIQKNIYNLPTCVVLRNNSGNHFTTANFDTLPRAEKLLIEYWLCNFFSQNYFYVYNMCDKFQGQERNTKNDIQNLPSTNMCSYKKPFDYYLLWHPPKGWEFFFFTWIFWHQTIYMLITFGKKIRGQKITKRR